VTRRSQGYAASPLGPLWAAADAHSFSPAPGRESRSLRRPSCVRSSSPEAMRSSRPMDVRGGFLKRNWAVAASRCWDPRLANVNRLTQVVCLGIANKAGVT